MQTATLLVCVVAVNEFCCVDNNKCCNNGIWPLNHATATTPRKKEATRHTNKKCTDKFSLLWQKPLTHVLVPASASAFACVCVCKSSVFSAQSTEFAMCQCSGVHNFGINPQHNKHHRHFCAAKKCICLRPILFLKCRSIFCCLFSSLFDMLILFISWCICECMQIRCDLFL